jgi:hypothetical protein
MSITRYLYAKYRLSPNAGEGVEKIRLDDRKETVIRLGNEYRVMDKNLARIEKFWREVVTPEAFQEISEISKMAFTKKILRWDLFEEHFLAFIVNMIDLVDKKIKKVSIYQLIALLFRELSTVLIIQDASLSWPPETIYHPSLCKDHAAIYNGPVVLKSTWLSFAKDGGLKRILLELAKSGFTEEEKLDENRRLVRLKSIATIDDGIYRYA